MKTRLALSAMAALLLTTLGSTAAAAGVDPASDILAHRLLRAATGAGGSSAQGQPAGNHTRQLGALNIAGGLHADVWAQGDFAYVGTWSGPCPGTGVKVVDVADPAQPRQVATAGGYANTSAEDMQVLSVHTDFFTGDLLATGLQNCGLPGQSRGRSGLDLWNVTDARHPVHLGFFSVAPATGVHEVSLTKRVIGGKERIFALAAVPFSEVVTTLLTARPVGDFQLIEVTDPRNPTLADDWGAGKDGGLPFGSPVFGLPAPFDCSPPTGQPPLCRGSFPAIFDHSASPSGDGRTAYLAYWDAGAIVLDMTNPNELRLVGRTPYPQDSDGDTHSAMPNAAGNLLVTTDEAFSPADFNAAGEPKQPGDTWGFARIWDVSDPAHPRHLSDFATPHSLTNKTDAFYSVHNPEIRGNTLYLSWYSDGVRVVDISNPAAPRQTAFFRPHPTADPTGVFVSFGAGGHPIPFVWGVHVVGDRIYLSDINFGLRIITLTG